MNSSTSQTATDAGVSYEGPPLVEVTLDETDFRIDAGKQGTALSISSRATGSWDWTFGGEARWDGSALRSRAFERRVLTELSNALSRALAELQ